MIHHPAWGADHHVDASLEGMDLGAEIRASVDRQHIQMGMSCGIGLEGISHLHGQLTGRGQHQHPRVMAAAFQALQQRQCECGGLARAGLGLSHQIAAQHQFGEGCLLNR